MPERRIAQLYRTVAVVYIIVTVLADVGPTSNKTTLYHNFPLIMIVRRVEAPMHWHIWNI